MLMLFNILKKIRKNSNGRQFIKLDLSFFVYKLSLVFLATNVAKGIVKVKLRSLKKMNMKSEG